MPSIDVLIAFTLASLVLNISPGPSNLYVMARSISQGVRGGMVAASGLALGSLVHVGATVLGLSVLFVHAPILFTLVKFGGAAYLIYLGISYWTSIPSEGRDGYETVSPRSLPSIFWESVVVEVSNPKTALFFIAFLPQFVDPAGASVALQLLILGVIVTLSGLPCDLLVATSASRAANWLSRNQRSQRIQQRVSASILFGMGAYIFADELRGR